MAEFEALILMTPLSPTTYREFEEACKHLGCTTTEMLKFLVQRTIEIERGIKDAETGV